VEGLLESQSPHLIYSSKYIIIEPNLTLRLYFVVQLFRKCWYVVCRDRPSDRQRRFHGLPGFVGEPNFKQ
jgi:hypothetical protein